MLVLILSSGSENYMTWKLVGREGDQVYPYICFVPGPSLPIVPTLIVTFPQIEQFRLV